MLVIATHVIVNKKKNEAYQWYWKKCESLLWQGPELLLLAASLYVIPENQLIMCINFDRFHILIFYRFFLLL